MGALARARQDEGRSPRRLCLGGLFGKRLEGLVDAMAHESLVDVTLRDGPAFDPETGLRPGAFGFTFGTSVLPDREDGRVPTLAVWVDTEAASVPRTHRAELMAKVRAGLVALLDRAMAERGLQASLFRVGAPTTMGSPAYETACHFPHDIGTQRAFVTRYLRVPGCDTTWLGAALVGHLGPEARATLDALADVAPCGPALRVTLRERARFSNLEGALAALLPTFDEAHALAVALLEGRS